LQKYALPTPQSMFTLDYFKENPAAFYTFCKELWPGRYTPTTTHCFIRLLHEKGKLLRCFTQNIDSLEAAAGLPKEKYVAAHGNFDSARCIKTGKVIPVDEMKEAVMAGEAGWKTLASKHGALCKPDITMFGEKLPGRYFRLVESDFGECDLLIVIGTSLAVQPFNQLIEKVKPSTPRLLINRERVREGNGPARFRFDEQDESNSDSSTCSQRRDVLALGECDAVVAELAALLGWTADLDSIVAEVLNGGDSAKSFEHQMWWSSSTGSSGGGGTAVVIAIAVALLACLLARLLALAYGARAYGMA
jgi:NAD-dependent deacetylase sirtuin 2